MTDMLTVQETARILRCCQATIYNAIKDKRGVGKLFVATPKLLVDKKVLVDWVEGGCEK